MPSGKHEGPKFYLYLQPSGQLGVARYCHCLSHVLLLVAVVLHENTYFFNLTTNHQRRAYRQGVQRMTACQKGLKYLPVGFKFEAGSTSAGIANGIIPVKLHGLVLIDGGPTGELAD